MKKIIDTNVLLDYPQIVEKEDDNLIALSVLKELDGLKKHLNKEVAEKARRAAVYISRNLDKLKWDSTYRDKVVDEQLLDITKENDGVLITNDVYLKVQAIIKGIRTEGYGDKDEYSGVAYWSPNLDSNLYSKELENIYEKGVVPEGLKLSYNQFLIVKNKYEKEIDKYGIEDYKDIAAFRYDGFRLNLVKDTYAIHNKYIDTLRARNTEQQCLLAALSDRDNKIVYAGGCAGSGKSFILTNFALQELERGKISKIIYVPNNAYTKDSLEVGTLPGGSKLLG